MLKNNQNNLPSFKLLIFFLVSSTFFFVSCQKELSEKEIAPILPQKEDSTLLSMYVEIDTSAISPKDTICKTLFYYDNARRNIGIDIITYYDGIITNRQYKSTFYFNGNDTVPARKIVTTPFLLATDQDYINDTCFYFYINSLLIGDSTIQQYIHGRFTTVNKYQYTNGRIINNSTLYSDTPSAIYYKTDTIYSKYTNGNVVSQIQIDTFLYYTIRDFKYSYDTHPNPFYRTQYKIALDNHFPFYYIETFIEEIFEKNNALEINEVLTFDTSHFKNVYEYKLNGYPNIVRFYNQNNPSDFGKGFYYYTK